MRVTISAKLKLRHTPEQKAMLDAVSLAYRDALNFASKEAFKLDKTSSAPKIHKAAYETLRERFGLGAQLACTVERQVAATYKAQWTKLKQNLSAREKGFTKRRYKGLDSAPKFVSRTLEYQYGRDYSWKKDGRVSISTLRGRTVLEFDGYQKHLDAIAAGCEMGAAKLYYQKSKKQYYLIVALNLELPDPRPTDHKNVVGVDVGQRYHFVATDQDGRSLFEKGAATRQRKDQFTRTRKSLQRKGTRSATRRLVALSSRERRFVADRNHVLSQMLLTRFPGSIFGLEDLTNIRERTEGRRSPKASKKAKRAKRHRSQWSFAELQTMLAYKAPLHVALAVRVDANYTSQCCPRCGHCSKANRPNAGLEFVCEVCGDQGHADRVASVNIGLRTMLVRQDWMSTGALSMRPDVSDNEAKAARLSRYTELRWSPDANPRL
ncbi:transposase (plasmid) [Deinococcus metallilatus]|uniref:IS200/IS605 family element transposase accessory protein TnpB n=1 Tax=Deinococcus metallilatus TaxID=1211322 RepID=A0AAJ5F7H6_9DEIO|nr:RNA-guided endonuclease TnpB family protein [Deinococcus metallilatus]MBB5297282.1 IS605 OrfB family transposase [Deinococcus metallilatus]QBY06971.1 transposase [Deinococcus metallilatus]TLK31918.1 IS200/IS605 family element transposase accessory protein TnpB [Deinococcus metallilatus]GMA17154.1 transposase [Deinococcus metallilatus]